MDRKSGCWITRTGDRCLLTRIETNGSTAPACVSSRRPGYVAATEPFCAASGVSQRPAVFGTSVTEPRPLNALGVASHRQNQACTERRIPPNYNNKITLREIVQPLDALNVLLTKPHHDNMYNHWRYESVICLSKLNPFSKQRKHTRPIHSSHTSPSEPHLAPTAPACVHSHGPGYVAATAGQSLVFRWIEGRRWMVLCGCGNACVSFFFFFKGEETVSLDALKEVYRQLK